MNKTKYNLKNNKYFVGCRQIHSVSLLREAEALGMTIKIYPKKGGN